MESNRYQVLASRTMNKFLTKDETVLHALFGMVGEIGEIHSIYQKTYQGHKFDEDLAKRETGDLLWFVAEFCTANGWTMEEVMTLNIDKLKSRYPNGFESDKSLNRSEGDV